MQLSFTLKSLGKKKAYINNVSIDINIFANTTVKELLLQVVSQQVIAFNKRKEDSNLLVYLSEEDIFNKFGETGNVKFNEQYNPIQADEEKAKEAVLLAFEDGLIAFFINEEQFDDLNQSIILKENDSITLIRLTFLAGSIW
jgi:hypothetical protein